MTLSGVHALQVGFVIPAFDVVIITRPRRRCPGVSGGKRKDRRGRASSDESMARLMLV